MFKAREMQALDAELAAGAVLLVPNFPASTQLTRALVEWRRTNGAPAVQPAPAIAAVDLWLRRLWAELANSLDDPRLALSLLEPDQELLLWRRVIDDSPAGATLLNPEGTAREAREAWNLVLQWRLPTDFVHPLRRDLVEPEACDCFGDWAWHFGKLCAGLGALSLSQMLGHLLDFCETRGEALRAFLPNKLLLHGFSDPPPLYQALLTAIGRLGCSVADLGFDQCQPRAEQRSCQESGEELRAAVRWAAEQLRHNPSAHIGIVAPSFASLQPALDGILRQEFADLPPGSWQVLEPRRLDADPFVHTALQLPLLLDQEMDTLELCALLRSPWLVAADAEANLRGKLERRLRDCGELLTPLTRLREFCAAQRPGEGAPALAGPLLQLHGLFLRLPRQQAFAAWLDFILACWQGLLDEDALLRSGQVATWRSWKAFLEHLQNCDWLQPPCSFHEALATVRGLAAARSLPATPGTARVLLLSPLACAGLRFSHLWCLQTDELHWPGETRLSAWLPWSLQQAHGMPGSDPALHLEQATRRFAALQASTSEHFIASWSQVEEDCRLRPSPLLASLPGAEQEPGSVCATLHPALAQLVGTACERVADAVIVPWREALPFRGDAALLMHQAACPFRAFARYRLRARPLETPRPGLSPAALGTLLHRMMELFWNALQERRALFATSAGVLQQQIERCVAEAVSYTARRYPGTLKPRFRQLEEERLASLLQSWLGAEQERGDFTVLHTEYECEWRHERLLLRIRIDRVDRDAGGDLVLVDYKSGKLPKPRWEETRQDEPQLLLYLQALEQSGRHREPVAALLYARIHVQEPGYSGISAGPGICAGTEFSSNSKLESAHWQELKDRWQSATTLLADEFLRGEARVAPLRKDSCRYCHLHGLCRIGEQQTGEDEDELEESDAD